MPSRENVICYGRVNDQDTSERFHDYMLRMAKAASVWHKLEHQIAEEEIRNSDGFKRYLESGCTEEEAFLKYHSGDYWSKLGIGTYDPDLCATLIDQHLSGPNAVAVDMNLFRNMELPCGWAKKLPVELVETKGSQTGDVRRYVLLDSVHVKGVAFWRETRPFYGNMRLILADAPQLRPLLQHTLVDIRDAGGAPMFSSDIGGMLVSPRARWVLMPVDFDDGHLEWLHHFYAWMKFFFARDLSMDYDFVEGGEVPNCVVNLMYEMEREREPVRYWEVLENHFKFLLRWLHFSLYEDYQFRISGHSMVISAYHRARQRGGARQFFLEHYERVVPKLPKEVLESDEELFAEALREADDPDDFIRFLDVLNCW